MTNPHLEGVSAPKRPTSNRASFVTLLQAGQCAEQQAGATRTTQDGGAWHEAGAPAVDSLGHPGRSITTRAP